MKIIIQITFLFLFTLSAHAQIDYSNYQLLLDNYVDKNGLVDYEEIASDKLLEKTINQFAGVEWKSLPEKSKLAFLINAYNLFAIKNVVDYYPISSPMDVENFFKIKKFELDGEIYSLDNIEYKLIFKIDSVMIHFGIVCAAKSCPNLIKQHYNSENLYSLLEENVQKFMNDDLKNSVDHTNKTIYLSQIFRWFRKQFEAQSTSLIEFVEKYAPDNWKSGNDLSDYDIKFLEYNWSLNEQ